jgi:hypothetical protein
LQVAGRVDQAGHFIRAQHAWCPVMRVLGIGYRVGRKPPFEDTPEEEAHGGDLIHYCADGQLSFVQQMSLPLPDMIRAQSIGRFTEVARETLDGAKVTAYSG